METEQAVVIGAGPYGLSAAAHLRQRGLAVRVFGETMSAWRHNMPAGMFLKSAPEASTISVPRRGVGYDDYCVQHGLPFDERHPIPVETFIDYGDWVESRAAIGVERRVVDGVHRDGSRFAVELDDGTSIETQAVVVATGHLAHAYVPSVFDEIVAAGAATHSEAHDDASVFAGKRLAVIGAGQSALEIAGLAHEAGADVHILVRAPQVLWAGDPDPRAQQLLYRMWKPPSGLGPGWSLRSMEQGAGFVRFAPDRAREYLVRTILGPAGAWWLRPRVEGKVDIRTSCRVERATPTEDGAVALSLARPGSSEHLEVDHVVVATGYRYDVRKVSVLDAGIRNRIRLIGGAPRLGRGFESSEPGVFFTGLSSAHTFGPLMRFVCGTRFASPRLARAVAATTGQTGRSRARP